MSVWGDQISQMRLATDAADDRHVMTDMLVLSVMRADIMKPSSVIMLRHEQHHLKLSHCLNKRKP